LAGDDPIPIIFGPKGTDPQQEGCTFHTWHAVESALADLLVVVGYRDAPSDCKHQSTSEM